MATEVHFTDAQEAALLSLLGLPADPKPPAELVAELLLARIHAGAREFCGLRPGDPEVGPGDVAAVRAALAVLDGADGS
jgi:hypothetical protein